MRFGLGPTLARRLSPDYVVLEGTARSHTSSGAGIARHVTWNGQPLQAARRSGREPAGDASPSGLPEGPNRNEVQETASHGERRNGGIGPEHGERAVR